MAAGPLRVLLAVDDFKRAAALASHLRAAGHDEIIVVEARGTAALKAARLLHPDLVVLSGPLRGSLDGVALATALPASPGAGPVPVILVADPDELPGLLALRAWPRAASGLEAPGPTDAAPDAALEEAGA